MTPTKDNPIFTFKELIKVERLAGMIILVKIWNLLALKVFAILITSLSVLIKPFKFSKIVTIKEIATAITIIAGVPAPTQIMITGPQSNLW